MKNPYVQCNILASKYIAREDTLYWEVGMSQNQTTTNLKITKHLLVNQYVLSNTVQIALLILTQLLSLLYFILVIQFLTFEEIAILGKASTVLSISLYIIPFGMFYTVSQMIPSKLSKNDVTGAIRISSLLIKEGLLFSATVSSVIVLSLLFFLSVPLIYLFLTLASFYLLSIFLFINQLNNAWLNLTKYVTFSYARIILTYLFSISLYFLSRRLESIFIGWIVGLFIGLPFLYRATFTEIKKKNNAINEGPSEDVEGLNVIAMIMYGLPMYINSIVNMLNLWVDRLLTAVLFTAESFAIYFVMSRVASVFESFISSIRNGLIPILSFLTKEKGKERIRRTYRIVFDYIFLITFGVLIATALYSDVIIRILIGEKYLGGCTILSVLLITILFRVLKHTLISFPAAAKDISAIPKISTVVFIVRLFLIYYLYPLGGLYVAIAMLLSEIINVVLIYIVYRAYLSLSYMVIFKASISMIPVLFFSFLRFNNAFLDLSILASSIVTYFVLSAMVRVIPRDEIKVLKLVKIPLMRQIIYLYAKIGRY